MPRSRIIGAVPPLHQYAFMACVEKTFQFIFYSYSPITWQSENFLFKVDVSGNNGERVSTNNPGPLFASLLIKCNKCNLLHVISVTDSCYRVTNQLQVTNNNNNILPVCKYRHKRSILINMRPYEFGFSECNLKARRKKSAFFSESLLDVMKGPHHMQDRQI